MKNKLIILGIGAVVVIGGYTIFSGGSDGALVPAGEHVSLSETAKQSTVTKQVEIPEVPLYPDSVLQKSSESVRDDGVRFVTLTLSTPDSVADVNTWYRGAFKENGWSVSGDKVVGGYVLLKGEKADLEVMMQAARSNNGTGAVITETIKILAE